MDMLLRFIVIMAFGLAAAGLVSAGATVSTWEFWVVMLCMLVSNAANSILSSGVIDDQADQGY